MSGRLVVYFSCTSGNTKRIAERVAREKAADIARIETVVPYTGNYDAIVEQGRREVEEGFKPELKPFSADLSKYDILIVGTPTWWYTMAPAVRTFLEDNDFSGKTVVPYMTNGGWPGSVIDDMRKVLRSRGARVVQPMEIQFDSTGGSRMVTKLSEVDGWIDRIP